MVDNSRDVRKQVFDVISCCAAVVTIIAYLVLLVNANLVESGHAFLQEGTFVMTVLNCIKEFGALVVVALVGIEYVADKNVVVRFGFYAVIAVVAVLMFCPGAWDNFIIYANRVKDAITSVGEGTSVEASVEASV